MNGERLRSGVTRPQKRSIHFRVLEHILIRPAAELQSLPIKALIIF